MDVVDIACKINSTISSLVDVATGQAQNRIDEFSFARLPQSVIYTVFVRQFHFSFEPGGLLAQLKTAM